MLFLPCTAPRPHHGDALAALPPHAEDKRIDKRSRAHASACERSVRGAEIGAERTKNGVSGIGALSGRGKIWWTAEQGAEW